MKGRHSPKMLADAGDASKSDAVKSSVVVAHSIIGLREEDKNQHTTTTARLSSLPLRLLLLLAPCGSLWLGLHTNSKKNKQTNKNRGKMSVIYSFIPGRDNNGNNGH